MLRNPLSKLLPNVIAREQSLPLVKAASVNFMASSRNDMFKFKKYCNRYHFLVNTEHSQNNIKFDAPQFKCQTNPVDPSTVVITPSKINKSEYFGDPIVTLMNNIADYENEMYFKIIKISDGVTLVYPGVGVPAHFMTYIRDRMHMKYGTTHLPINIGSKVLTDPFGHNFMATFAHYPEDEIKESKLLDSHNDSYFENLSARWSNMVKTDREKLVEQAYRHYTMHNYTFQVNDPNWCTSDGMRVMRKINNKAWQFMRMSEEIYCLIYGVSPLGACGGGLYTNVYTCPVWAFWRNQGYSTGPPGEFKGSTKYHPKNYVPYWHTLYVEDMIKHFGVNVQ